LSSVKCLTASTTTDRHGVLFFWWTRRSSCRRVYFLRYSAQTIFNDGRWWKAEILLIRLDMSSSIVNRW
jgi:hypothetical protein